MRWKRGFQAKPVNDLYSHNLPSRMQKLDLSDRIIKLDRNIRFAGLVNDIGEVIEGGFQLGVEPLLEGTDEQQMYVQALSNMSTLQQFRSTLEKMRYSITEHEKVILLTISLPKGVLCVSASSKVDAVKLRDKVLKAIKSGSRGKRSNKK